MNDEILRLAKECGFNDFGSAWYDDRLEAFYRAAFNAGLEAAAKHMASRGDNLTSSAIRELEKK